MIQLQGAILLAASYASAFAPPGTPEHALAAWIKTEGGFIGDVAVEKRDGVRGLYTTKDVPKGTLLLSVPEACCIAANEDPQWGLSLRELAQRQTPLRVLVRCDTTRFRDAEQQRAFGHVFRRIEAADAVSFFHGDVADKATFRLYPRRECVFRRARRRESARIISSQHYGTLQPDHLNNR